MKESRKLEFTEGWIRRLDPAPQGKRVAYSDMVVQGLRLRVNDQGEKVFSVVYRLRGDSSGAPKTFTIGRYPDEYKIKGARDEALLRAARTQGRTRSEGRGADRARGSKKNCSEPDHA